MARQPAKETAEHDKPLSRRVLVNIKRDQTATTPRVVWQHEIPILEQIFGDGNVVEVDPATLDEGYSTKQTPDMLVHNKKQDPIKRPSESLSLGWVFVGNPQTEYERLCSAYGRHTEMPIPNCEHVYGRFQAGAFEKLVGKPELSDLPDDQLRDLIKAWGFEIPHTDTKSTPEQIEKAAEARAKFNTMTSAELVALAEELGVEIGA